MNERPDGDVWPNRRQGARSPANLIFQTPIMSETDGVASSASLLSPRPAFKSQHSASVPSTPNHRAVDRPLPIKSPSAKRNASNPSPRAHHSASLPPPRRLIGGCKYETAMANAKRRVPYSLGPDKLDADPELPKASLAPAEDERLTTEMTALYEHLIPSPESEDRRRRLIEKLSMILRNRWPHHNITVNVFGSTGNKLGTTESDVDICITTDCRELEQVCVLADFLANQGMQRVVCISAAKVPIVKIWDPDLRLACDLNVNNPVALVNTDMIRSYIEIDPRVRPLAMIIKHWTKRRVLNEAGRPDLTPDRYAKANECTALGGTLSSYTWICMIINFLQTRNPPVLPALQQKPFLENRILSGLNVAFDRDTASYASSGSKNKDSLGMLMFQFFRYYAHEIDYETSVMSVRAGKVITKAEKHWHLLQDNRLCVEEPFNTSRNLGNTADNTSVRGIHLELRRAFKMVSAAQLGRCCDEYEAPSTVADEPRPLDRPSFPGNRPSPAHPPSTLGRNPRGGSRNSRPTNPVPRLSCPARRASSASTKGYTYPQSVPLTANPTQTEMSLQAQQRQYLLHDHLYLQYQYLQAQEQELRAQLNQQALSQSRVAPVGPCPPASLTHSAISGAQDDLMRVRAGRVNHPPLTAPIRPQGLAFSTPYGARPHAYGATTNPPSPLLHTIIPDSRRSYRRLSMTTGSSFGSLRAQSQPPRPVPSPLSIPSTMDRQREHMPKKTSYQSNRNTASSSSSTQDFAEAVAEPPRRMHRGSTSDRTGSEYMGYYLGPSPPLPLYSRSVVGTPLTSASGLGIQNGSISPHMLAQLSCNPLSMSSLTSEPARWSRADSEATPSVQEDGRPSLTGNGEHSSRSRSSSGPVVVNGSIKRGSERRQSLIDLYGSLNTTSYDASASDDVAVDTPISSDEHSQDMVEPPMTNGYAVPILSDQAAPNLPRKQRRSSNSSRSVAGITGASCGKNRSKVINETLSSRNKASAVTESTEVSEPLGSNALSHEERHIRIGASRLSPVTEAGLCLSTQTRPSVGERNAQALSKAKGKGKAKGKKYMPSPVDPGERKDLALGTQPTGTPSPHPTSNGIPQAGKEAVSGWQTQKKRSKHKKGSKSETDLKGINAAGGEFLPLNESMRKGG